jgi:ketosteroid isomerase-like protein
MTNEELVDRYFDALASFDLATVRALVHDDLVFKGPLAELSSADDYVRGLEHASAMIRQVDRRSVIREGDRAVQIYDVTLGDPAATVRVAESLQISGGKIMAIEMVLDPRPLLASASQPAG